MMKKGYAGGLVVSATIVLHIGSLGFWPDDVSVSFTVCGFLLLRQLEHMNGK